MGWEFCRNGLVVLSVIVPTEMFYANLIDHCLNIVSFYQWHLTASVDLISVLRNKVRFKGLRGLPSGILSISLVAGLNTQMDKIAIQHLVESLSYYMAFSLVGYYCWYIFLWHCFPIYDLVFRWGSGQNSQTLIKLICLWLF
jgi:hypothetical protein